MSTVDSTPVTIRSFFGGSLRYFVLIWFVMLAGGAAILYWTDHKTVALRNDLEGIKDGTEQLKRAVQQGPAEAKADLNAVKKEHQAATERLRQIEQTLGTYHGQFQKLEDRSSESQSRQAVERSKVAVVAAQVKSARNRLQKLRSLLSSWQALEASLLRGDSGRRIAASSSHLALVVGVLDEERPSPQKLEEWELTLEALATPVEQSNRDTESTLVLTSEHAQQLNDLGQQLVRAVSQLEQQQSLVSALIQETASQSPSGETLDAILQRKRSENLKQCAERLVAVRETAREEVAKELADRIRQTERQTVEAEIQRQEQIAKAKTEQEQKLASLEQERISAETQVKEAEARARIAELNGDRKRLDAATQRAQLEKEYNRDLPTIRSVLAAFITPGFQQRGQSPGEGPMSYALIQGAGALSQTSDGRQNLAHLVGNNDRPSGPLKRFRGGQTRDEESMATQAQSLLTKYGALMVEKGLLAP